jgi:hypothetical protein
MRKLQLDLDEIRVQSFHTVTVDGPKGTVHAAQEGASDKATCDTCQGPNCKPPPTRASGGDVCCA